VPEVPALHLQLQMTIRLRTDDIIRQNVASKSWAQIARLTGMKLADARNRWHHCLKPGATPHPSVDCANVAVTRTPLPPKMEVVPRGRSLGPVINFQERDEARGFVHKRLIGAAKGFVTGGPTGALGGFLTRGGDRGEHGRNVKFPMATAPATTFRPLGRQITGPCRWPMRIDPISGECRAFIGDRPGPDRPPLDGRTDSGMRAMTAPEVLSQTRLRCPKGYVLNLDDWCVFGLPRNSKARKWKPGRRPKFTGGDLNAISTAAGLADEAEELFKKTNPAKKAVARNYRANWRKPLKK